MLRLTWFYLSDRLNKLYWKFWMWIVPRATLGLYYLNAHFSRRKIWCDYILIRNAQIARS